MAASKKYFHDHLVLLLLSITIFLGLGASIFVLVSIGTGHTGDYIVQCRDCSNTNALNRFTSGNVVNLLSFVVFALLVMVAQTTLSLRVYRIHRQVAIATLGLGILLLTLAIIISNALLVLR